MSGKLIIKLKDVSVEYDGVFALENINLEVKEDDFLGIIGPNGAGKTTLLKVILGLIKPSSGSMEIFADNVRDKKFIMGYVPQKSHFDKDFPASVFDIVLMGRYPHRNILNGYTAEDKAAATGALEKLRLELHKNKSLGELSGGEQQRVFIARALAIKPKILLLDEPVASVDAALQTEFYDLLDELKQEMAIIMVSHDIGAVSVHVDKIACINSHLYYHGSGKVGTDILEKTYKCPVQIITHGEFPHRVLREHKKG